jgi:hypothetical protein
MFQAKVAHLNKLCILLSDTNVWYDMPTDDVQYELPAKQSYIKPI